MKVALKRVSVPGSKPSFIPPPIPFERAEPKNEEDPTKSKSTTAKVGFDLRAQPADANSQTYKLYLEVFP